MSDYLIFQLTAALGAMGEFAGHERRGSLIWPGRSALIGLIGAAFGLRRGDDFSELDRLRMAVAIFDPGEPLRDYHTVETIPTAAARRPQARPEALRLARGRTNTTITLRDYRTGPFYGVAVWNGPLDALMAALQRPVFTLYLGRKSCPLAAPLDPMIVSADCPEAALAALRLPFWRRGAVATIMSCDERPEAARHETRHDMPEDRSRWHFSARDVAVVPVRIAPEAAQ